MSITSDAMSDRLRIGVIANTLLATEGNYAGGQLHTMEVAARWLAEGHDVVVFAPEFAESAIKAHVPNATFVSLPDPFPKRGRIVVLLARAASSFRSRRELQSCDVLFAASPFLADVVPLWFARGTPSVVFLAHLLGAPWRRPGNLVWNFIAGLNETAGLFVTSQVAGAIVTCSHFVSGQIHSRGLRQPCYVTTNGVDRSPMQAPQTRAGAVCVSRIHPAKGIGDLIRAWRIVVDHLPDQTLTIVGGGELEHRQMFESLIDRLELRSHVNLVGAVPNSERDTHLARASIFTFASHEEGWGIAVAEALAAGLPCVTYDLPVFREVFPEGRISAPIGDVAGFARQTIRLLSDDRERAILADAGLKAAEHFRWETAAAIDERALVEATRRHA